MSLYNITNSYNETLRIFFYCTFNEWNIFHNISEQRIKLVALIRSFNKASIAYNSLNVINFFILFYIFERPGTATIAFYLTNILFFFKETFKINKYFTFTHSRTIFKTATKFIKSHERLEVTSCFIATLEKVYHWHLN